MIDLFGFWLGFRLMDQEIIAFALEIAEIRIGIEIEIVRCLYSHTTPATTTMWSSLGFAITLEIVEIEIEIEIEVDQFCILRACTMVRRLPSLCV